MSAEEKERVAKQQASLGEGGLKDKGDHLERAIAQNEVDSLCAITRKYYTLYRFQFLLRSSAIYLFPRQTVFISILLLPWATINQKMPLLDLPSTPSCLFIRSHSSSNFTTSTQHLWRYVHYYFFFLSFKAPLPSVFEGGQGGHFNA